ncbi:diketogulonate reductase-like aldo/keto reductase [Geomicrobium halophilum]|uniref:Diketogulonate reductase-like aldo/keto reductase n=1 Tax=Geomicrobium halophilum TaxID=549000 RepID=A0A841PTN0_9BACL|nr:aldo/keto reductase [Geomicrobium halophilum]MBB6451134.1 diketogulonate reductase-like aldo/keto reductase [Geomicrobium halophilum]
MVHQSMKDVIRFNNGVVMPQHGFGIYLINDPSVIEKALDAGYRSFDTAQMYGNEALLGETLNESDVKREELFITTKIANENQGYDSTLASFEQSLADLGISQVDLLLVHWPSHQHMFETWKAFERLYEENVARAIGVCNFNREHIEKLTTKANVKPVINQIECHPYLTQYPLKDYLDEQEIVTEAWSPLGRGMVLSDIQLEKIAEKYNKTVAQVILRWHLQQDTVIIPKSATASRIEANTAIYDFQLTEEDMAVIDRLNKEERRGPNPDQVFMEI